MFSACQVLNPVQLVLLVFMQHLQIIFFFLQEILEEYLVASGHRHIIYLPDFSPQLNNVCCSIFAVLLPMPCSV